MEIKISKINPQKPILKFINILIDSDLNQELNNMPRRNIFLNDIYKELKLEYPKQIKNSYKYLP